VRSGSAREIAEGTSGTFSGGALRLSHVRIDGHIAYAQYSDRHLLHATLGGRALRSVGRVAQDDWTGLPDRRGTISFTPAARERHGTVRRAQILGLQIELDRQLVEDACEQRLGRDWRNVFNSDDAKAFAFAERAGNALVEGESDGLMLDMLMLGLARHLGRTYGHADRRRDDGWLHPAALGRVVDQIRSDPGRPIPLHEMARSAGLGVSAFVRAFRGSTGVTPAAFALKLRLDHAAQMLRSTDLGAREIAALSGFASAAHLVRTFRVHRGITPGRWRREAAQQKRELVSQNPRKDGPIEIGDTLERF
jgi:AraC family transcriptional regulator